MRRGGRTVIAAVVAGGLAFSVVGAHADSVDSTPIPIPAHVYGCPGALDGAGIVTGYDWHNGIHYRWSRANGLLTHPPAGLPTMADVNRAGMVLFNNGFDSDTFVWSPTLGLIDLAPLTPEGFSARHLGGSIVAGMFTDAAGQHLGVWSPSGGFRDLGTMPVAAGTAIHVVDVNEADQIVGDRQTPQGRWRGWFWDPAAGLVQLGTAFGPSFAIGPAALNDAGVVAGSASSGSGPQRRLFRWTLADGMSPLGPTDEELQVTDIGNDGTIVGINWAADLSATFRYTDGGGYQQIGRGYPVKVNSHGIVLIDRSGVPPVVVDAIGAHDVGEIDAAAVDLDDRGNVLACERAEPDGDARAPVLHRIETPVVVDWSAAELARIQELMTFYDMGYDELVKFGVYVAAFINAIDPSPAPTPITVDPPGTAQSQTIVWRPDEIELLNAVADRWVLDDEGAHRWGFMLLSFIAILQGH